MLEGQVALITGASSGIGRATVEAFAREGASVAVNYCKNRSGAEQAVETIRKIGREAVTVKADVTQSAEVKQMMKTVLQKWGRIDILVNNAGDLLARRTLADMTEEYWDQVMDL
ncbi:MAG TPA: SDR family NAD(P)-dependent oxidoreductase, partial [Terriglobia bacterium]|nr:SDR family NAD(P)-dependent oxidoreductase [Terriglobia bacterium]